MSSCDFQPVCATMPRTIKKGGGFGTVNTYAARCVQLKEAQMHPLKHIMLPAWLQYSDHKNGSFYGIISDKATPHNATVARADNTNDCLTIATYVGGARL